MTRRRSITVELFIAACLALMVITALAIGHDPATKYPRYWVFGPDQVDYQFKTDFPTGDWRDRVKDGVDDWNEVGEPMQFFKAPGDTSGYPRSSCAHNYQNDFVQKAFVDGGGGIAAITDVCSASGAPSVMYSFVVTFDDAETWYKGTGTPGGNQLDAWSVASHELGHGTGWGPHFDTSAPECTNAPKHTMCGNLSPGQTFPRDLAEHDRHTFGARY